MRTLMLGLLAIGCVAAGADEPPRRQTVQVQIERRVPPPGIELDAAVKQKITARLATLRKSAMGRQSHPLFPDVDIYLKAVSLALENGEFYRPQDGDAALQLLDAASDRLQQLAAGKSPWRRRRGLVVRGFRSEIDGSPQPYGLDIPAELDLQRPVPVVVWLHGRGDKTTDLHFIRQRATRAGPVRRDDAIVIHPFGRQCIGYKSAGETDVLEAIEHLATQYPVDRDRIALMGFSMGGAGAWHLGAHFAGRWCALSPGAGFAETAEYNRLQAADYPRPIEQQLWGQYDAPCYVRNLFNIPRVVAYSGELDRQIQAARVMERAYWAEGRALEHRIGAGMGHKYHPQTLAAIQERITEALRTGRETTPKTIHLQTRTLKYSRQRWVEATGLGQHWKDSRIDAAITGSRQVSVATKNIRRLRFSPFPKMAGGRSCDRRPACHARRRRAETCRREMAAGRRDGRPVDQAPRAAGPHRRRFHLAVPCCQAERPGRDVAPRTLGRLRARTFAEALEGALSGRASREAGSRRDAPRHSAIPPDPLGRPAVESVAATHAESQS